MIDWGFRNLCGSLEQVQVELFEKQICGGSKMSIFQYAMVLFLYEDKGILPSSLFWFSFLKIWNMPASMFWS